MYRLFTAAALALVLASLTLPAAPAPGAAALNSYSVAVGTGAMTGNMQCLQGGTATSLPATILIDHGAAGVGTIGSVPYARTAATMTVLVERVNVGSGGSPSDPLLQQCANVLAAKACLYGSPSTGYTHFECSSGSSYIGGWAIGPLGSSTSVSYTVYSTTYYSATVDFGPYRYVI